MNNLISSIDYYVNWKKRQNYPGQKVSSYLKGHKPIALTNVSIYWALVLVSNWYKSLPIMLQIDFTMPFEFLNIIFLGQ